MMSFLDSNYYPSPFKSKIIRLSTSDDAHYELYSDETHVDSYPRKSAVGRSQEAPKIFLDTLNNEDDDVFFQASSSIQDKENLVPSSNQSSFSSYLSPIQYKKTPRSHQRILSSFESSPKNLPSVNSPGRAHLHSFGLDVLKNNPKIFLGKGSFGTVVLGRLNGKRVAVKVVPRVDSTRLNRTDGEVNAKLLTHDNIVHLFGVFYDAVDCNNNIVIVMEYVGKTNLQQLINENKQILNESFIHRCLKDLSDALSHCHYKGMWHLDVKPSNVFVTSRGVCKLGDFGCSRLAGVSQDADFLVGTPGYQAPEMLQYQYASDKCDVYSFGVLCWQVIRKEIPYDGVHPHTIVYKVVSENFRPPDSTSLPSYFKPYQQIYRKSWDQNPKRRPDMKDIFLEIQSITVSRKISSSIKIRI